MVRTNPPLAPDGSWGGPSPRDLREMNELFAEATREWHELSESLHDLQAAMAPQEFEEALAHLEIPDLHVMKREWAKTEARFHDQVRSANAKSGTQAQSTEAQSTEAQKSKPAADESPPARVESIPKALPTSSGNRDVSEIESPELDAQKTAGAKTSAAKKAAQPRQQQQATKKSTKKPAAPVTPVQESAAAPPAAPAADSSAIQDRLQELVGLLKDHLSTPQPARQEAAAVQVSPELTLSIAREVAGRVKDSVLNAIRDSDLQPASDEAAAAGKGVAKAPPKEKRIPIDDVASMIDQLTSPRRE